MASGQQAEAQPAGGHPSIETLWPNWIGLETTNLEIGGSSPSRVPLSSVGLDGYDDCLTRSRSLVRSREVAGSSCARRRGAMAARRIPVPKVAGSIPVIVILTAWPSG